MNHASGAVTPPDAEVIQAGDIIWQRAERRGLVQGAVRPARVAEVPVLAQDELHAHPCIVQVHQEIPGLPHYPRLDRMPGGSEDPDAAGPRL